MFKYSFYKEDSLILSWTESDSLKFFQLPSYNYSALIRVMS